MKLIRYKTAYKYLEDNLTYLEENEAINSFIIARSLAKTKTEEDNSLYLSVSDNTGIQFTAVRLNGSDLIVYGNEAQFEFYAPVLIDYFEKEKISLSGILGPKKLVKNLANSITNSSEKDWQLVHENIVYVLSEIKYNPDCLGEFRKASIKDLDLLAPWFHAFLKEALHEDDTVAAKETARKKILDEEVFLWYDKAIVAMSCTARSTNKGISINYVYTPMTFRKKGYGTKLVAELAKTMLEKGYQFCTLHADVGNPASNRIYTKIGYESIGEFCLVQLISKTARNY